MFKYKTRHLKYITVLALVMVLTFLPGFVYGQITATRASFGSMGIKLNTKVYTVRSVNRGWWQAGDGRMQRLTSNQQESDESLQFVFITPTDNDTTQVYLYSISQKSFANVTDNYTNQNNGNGTLAQGSGTPIYIYQVSGSSSRISTSINAGYNELFTFTANKSGRNVNENNNGWWAGAYGSNTNDIDDGTLFKAFEVSSSSFTSADLEEARSILRFTLKGDFHSKGKSGRPLMANGMGDVAEVHYYYYVNPGQGSDANVPSRGDIKANNGIVLQLPFYDYYNDPDRDNRNGNNMEPNAYFRWFDYTTDGMPKTETVNGTTYQRITPWTSSNVKKVYDKDGKDLGYFYFNIGNINPNCSNVGVIYNIPDEARNKDWEGDVIGCDVSRYYDYNDSPTPDSATFTHEPTLSVRYVFHILPASKLADDMENTLINAKSDSLTVQDHALLVFGAKDGNASMNLRTQFSRLKDYWFHPYNGNGSVYHKSSDKNHSFSKSDFGTSLVRATGTEWRVYNSDSTAYRVFATTSSGYGVRPSGGNKRLQDRDLDISLDRNVSNGSGVDHGMYIHALNYTAGSNQWKSVATGNDTTVANITINSQCFIVGYATNGSQKCPFFNARLEINHLYPMSDAQIRTKDLTERTPSYLQAQYGSPVATFSFDNENNGQNFGMPDSFTSQNNFDLMPSPFSQRQYGFVYYDLRDWTDGLGRNVGTTTPLHGDYQIVKSMNVSLANNVRKTLYDRTHETSASQYGYFFYTDASQESRQIGYQDFDGTLCAGSQIIISAYVASTNAGVSQSQPELRFSLYGIDKDANGNVTSQKLFASVCTGNFRNNIEDYDTHNTFDAGTWYQVFGGVTLPTGVGIDNYSSFRITIDNYCNDTNGADYAIDDIEVFQNNSKLSVIQIPALCSDNEVSSAVDIKIKGNYNILREVSDADTQDKTVYYRFVKSDGSAVTGTNFYGTGHNNYGEATVPATYNSATKINGQNKFETNATGQREVVLVYQGFNLSQDSTYYVSLNYTNPATENAWGHQNAICTMYSSNFQMVKQNVVVNNLENGSVTVTVPCGQDSTTTYPAINVGVTAPDKTNGGKTTLNSIHFDWFNGTLAQYQAIKDDNDSTLSGAISHYRAAYNTGAYSSSNQPKTADNGMVYSAADKALIEKYLWSTSNSKGNLWMSGATSLSQAPLSAGRDTVLAIPIESMVTVNDSITYEICSDPMEIHVRGLSNGPGLVLGMSNINYPSSDAYRSVRIGLPQIRKMKQDGVLRIPVRGRLWQGETVTDEDLKFVDSNGQESVDVYISESNDPTITGTVKLAEVHNVNLSHDATTLELCKIDTTKIHEGYQYEIGFQFLRTNVPSDAGESFTQCSGETFLILKIVPEYLTWTPEADGGLNSNWNNDANWRRSTAGELYDASYKDYRTPTYLFQLHDSDGKVVATGNIESDATKTWHYNSIVDATLTGSQPDTYVPMYFSKVIIPTLTDKPYPMLGFIGRETGTNLITSMTNIKKHLATTNIQYDMEAAPASTMDSTNYDCAVFDGNICEQVYFKTGAQLRNEQFLNYQKAWCELALPYNTWGTFTTPMEQTISGDMYVPKTTAAQATPLFKDIHFNDSDKVDANGIPSENGEYGLFGKAGDGLYSRIRMPVYQKLWAENGNMYNNDTRDAYASYDSPYMMLIYPSVENGDEYTEMHQDDNAGSLNLWSHTFNAVGNPTTSAPQYTGVYKNAYGVAGKIGDDYAPSDNVLSINGQKYAIMRLPKADESFNLYYLDDNGTLRTGQSFDVSSQRGKINYRLGVEYSNDENDLGQVKLGTASLTPEPYGYAFDANGFIYDAGGNIEFTDKNGHVTDKPTGLVYDLIGNPYTSTITVKGFVDGNKSVLRTVVRDGKYVNRVWVLSGNDLVELDPDAGATIAPGQAFFAPYQIAGRDTVIFTTNMQTDPNISRGAKLNTLSLEESAAKIYRITDHSDVTNIVLHGVDSQLYCWSPSAGVLAVSGESIRRIEIYNISGQLVNRAEMSGTEKQFNVGNGVYIVKATLKDGSSQSQKLAVR